jgi:hypothetical protein
VRRFPAGFLHSEWPAVFQPKAGFPGPAETRRGLYLFYDHAYLDAMERKAIMECGGKPPHSMIAHWIGMFGSGLATIDSVRLQKFRR